MALWAMYTQLKGAPSKINFEDFLTVTRYQLCSPLPLTVVTDIYILMFPWSNSANNWS
jgi:hypothetical protein